MNPRNDACDRIALFAREGRLIQHGWHRTADDGREVAWLQCRLQGVVQGGENVVHRGAPCGAVRR